jgi:hypothetical protein
MGGKTVGESSKRLIALKRLDRQRMGGGARVPVDRPQRIPLGERRPDCSKPGVERSVVAVLDLFDCTTQSLQICGHWRSIAIE